jgi:hypothetical protein
MAIPHYTYLVLKMPSPNGVISVNGDIKQAYDCDKESCEMTDALLASIELQNRKKAMVKSLPDPVMPESRTSKLSIHPEIIQLFLSDPSKVTHVGNSLDPK